MILLATQVRKERQQRGSHPKTQVDSSSNAGAKGKAASKNTGAKVKQAQVDSSSNAGEKGKASNAAAKEKAAKRFASKITGARQQRGLHPKTQVF